MWLRRTAVRPEVRDKMKKMHFQRRLRNLTENLSRQESMLFGTRYRYRNFHSSARIVFAEIAMECPATPNGNGPYREDNGHLVSDNAEEQLMHKLRLINPKLADLLKALNNIHENFGTKLKPLGELERPADRKRYTGWPPPANPYAQVELAFILANAKLSKVDAEVNLEEDVPVDNDRIREELDDVRATLKRTYLVVEQLGDSLETEIKKWFARLNAVDAAIEERIKENIIS